MDTGKVIALTRRMIKKELSDLGPYHYVGTVADVNELPLTANVGDVYNVGNTSEGSNYAWNGTEWDKLGGESNTSNYELTSVSTVFPTIPSSSAPGLKLSDNNGNDSFVTFQSSSQLNLGGTFVPELEITSSSVGYGPGMPVVPAIVINLSAELSLALHTMKSDIELLKTKAGLN